jgi:hypothetical protein
MSGGNSNADLHDPVNGFFAWHYLCRFGGLTTNLATVLGFKLQIGTLANK